MNLDLAYKLLDKNTHLVGTLHSNRWGSPHEVVSKKIKLERNYGKTE